LWISAYFSGVKVGLGTLIGMRLRRVSPRQIIQPLIKATKTGLDLTTDQLEAHYLAGGNVNRVIGAVAKNGIEITVKAKVTVRANIERLVGGAGEDTIIPRVGEGIVTTVGSAERHDLVMESPEAISKTVLSKVLDSGTAFEILSIDIADVDVGRNIGAQLQTDQSEADKNIA